METLSYGFKKPESGDTGDIVFPALATNIQQLNDHTHDGIDSPALLLVSSLAPGIQGSEAFPVNIVAANGISFSGNKYDNMIFVSGSGGPITVSANPQIEPGINIGQKLKVIGWDAVNTVTLNHGNGLILNGPWVSFELGSILDLIWTGSYWVEIGRA